MPPNTSTYSCASVITLLRHSSLTFHITKCSTIPPRVDSRCAEYLLASIYCCERRLYTTQDWPPLTRFCTHPDIINDITPATPRLTAAAAAQRSSVCRTCHSRVSSVRSSESVKKFQGDKAASTPTTREEPKKAEQGRLLYTSSSHARFSVECLDNEICTALAGTHVHDCGFSCVYFELLHKIWRKTSGAGLRWDYGDGGNGRLAGAPCCVPPLQWR